MDASWSSLGMDQINSFLDKTNLGRRDLPSVAELNPAQWSILEGIIGVDTANLLRERVGIAHNAAAPKLPIPRLTDLSSVMSELSEMDLELNNVMEKFLVSNIQDNKSVLMKKAKEQQKALAEAADKLQKAADAKKQPWWKRLLNWIVAAVAAIVGVIVGIVSAPFTGGLGTAAAVLAVASFAMFILKDTGVMDKLAEALATHMQEKYGWSPEKAKMFGMFFTMGLELAVTIASVAVNIANAAKMASSAKSLLDSAKSLKGVVDATTKTVSLGATTASNAREAATLTLKALEISSSLNTVMKLTALSGLASSGMQVYNGAIEIQTANLTKDARESEALAAELKAFMQKLQSMLQEDSDRLKDLIARIQSMLNGFSDVIDEINSSHKAVIRSMNA